MSLTKPREALLAEVRAKGVVRKNGRARKTVEALVAAGLVEADFDLIPSAIPPWYWIITVTPVAGE